MSEAVREMTFEEEYEILQKEAEKLYKTESDGCETPFPNCIVRRALRCIKKLKKHYEELEKEGLLLQLPCKVGDTLWNIENKRVEPFIVREFKIYAYKINRIEIYFENTTRGFGVCLFDGTLDEGWYRTKEEAEAKLKEMESE